MNRDGSRPGELLTFEKIYPLDAVYDRYDEIPEDVRTNKRYKEVGDCSIGGLAERMVADFGERPVDIVVHSLANGPEVKKPLLDVSRNGYLGAVSASAVLAGVDGAATRSDHA
jgi:enoyl-[acyl-carrier protein] reductase I